MLTVISHGGGGVNHPVGGPGFVDKSLVPVDLRPVAPVDICLGGKENSALERHKIPKKKLCGRDLEIKPVDILIDNPHSREFIYLWRRVAPSSNEILNRCGIWFVALR